MIAILFICISYIEFRCHDGMIDTKKNVSHSHFTFTFQQRIFFYFIIIQKSSLNLLLGKSSIINEDVEHFRRNRLTKIYDTFQLKIYSGR